MPSVVSLTEFDDQWKGLIYTLKRKGYIIPSNNILSFQTSIIADGLIPEYVFDNNTKTHCYTREDKPYFILNFGNNKVLLSGFSLYGTTNPYTTAFNILGSTNGENWDVIKEYKDLGEELRTKSKTFLFDELTSLYNQIKIQSISSYNVYYGETPNCFGIAELEIYGVFVSSHYFFRSSCIINSHYNLFLISLISICIKP